ncbi:526_t:CDS:2 [Entrophospora sp. SA101]|nr:526_t:CDS:2 [Entrophospora sp. SA101]
MDGPLTIFVKILGTLNDDELNNGINTDNTNDIGDTPEERIYIVERVERNNHNLRKRKKINYNTGSYRKRRRLSSLSSSKLLPTTSPILSPSISPRRECTKLCDLHTITDH